MKYVMTEENRKMLVGPPNDVVAHEPAYDFLMSDELRSLVACKDGKPVATTSKPGPDCTIEFTRMTFIPTPEDQ